jgi:hypothetical protein
MPNAGEILKKFYAAVEQKDIASARRYLNQDLLFEGLFETYRSADEYLASLSQLLEIVVRLDVTTVIAEGDDVAVFFEFETKAPAAATTLVAERHQIKNGEIFHVRSAFDGRPFAAMFAGGPNERASKNNRPGHSIDA